MKVIESKFSHNFGMMALAVVILGAFAFISNAFAWIQAPSTQLTNSVNTSLHQGSLSQGKVGGLTLNTGTGANGTGAGANGLIVQYGKVGIGITSPTQALDVEGNVRATREHTDYICNRAGTTCLTFDQVYGFINGTIGTLVPATPTGLTATAASASSINLSWTASPLTTSYKIYRSLTNSGFTTPTASNVTGTSYVDAGLSASTLYYYEISGVNSNGEGPKSSSVNATTNANTPTGSSGSGAATLDAIISASVYTNSDGTKGVAMSGTGWANQDLIRHRLTVVGSSPRDWIELPGFQQSIQAGNSIPFNGMNSSSFWHSPDGKGTYTIEYDVVSASLSKTVSATVTIP